MPRYSPLPSVSIDPRNEAQLVQDASQVVYEASNQTLNDFSSGNPLAALIEGQAFAQGEFLFWANQLPQKILIEWIGPFLGAMRRLGTPSSARLKINLPPQTTTVRIAAGSVFNSTPTDGNSAVISFVTDEDVIIPAGETEAHALVFSQFVGAEYNLPANTITGSSNIDISGLTATNPLPAVGGSDVETFDEVQERFFTLIRRRNPVSAQDWKDFFEDVYGPGTQTSVLPNRTSVYNYNYYTDYILPTGQVSFFVLGPGGVELTPEQISRGQNLVNFSLPVQGQGHLYPITLSDVQYNITLSINPTGSYGSNLRQTSLDFRDRLYQVLQPGNVFPSNFTPSLGDVNSAFYATFNTETRFEDPVVESATAYNTPDGLSPQAATYTQVYNYTPQDYILTKNDLVEITSPLQKFYPVTTSFTPVSSSKLDQPIYGNLKLGRIGYLSPGQFSQGDVVYWGTEYAGDEELHVVLENLVFTGTADIEAAYARGQISTPKVYSPWVVGGTFAETVGGTYNPDIVQYDYTSDEFIPDQYSTVSVDKRPGTLVWLVTNNFTLQPSTNDFTGATTGGLVSSTSVIPQNLVYGQTYTSGTWVKTLQVGSGPDPNVDPNFYYVDVEKGAVTKYAYVEKTFTYTAQGETVSEYFDSLVFEGTLKEIVVQSADSGLPIYLYKPRFATGQYLMYRAFAGGEISYCIAANYFTPTSSNLTDLIEQGLVVDLAPSPGEKDEIALQMSRGLVKLPVKMFVFFKGDRTFIRENTLVKSYTATASFSPLFDFSVYLKSGTLVETATYFPAELAKEDYVPLYDPAYEKYSEDTVLDLVGGNMYRVMKAFTPGLTTVNWTGLVVDNTARDEEYKGNLLRYVQEYVCEEDIQSPLGEDISAIKLGVAQVTLIPKSTGVNTSSFARSSFVWEATSSFNALPQLSWFTGTTYAYSPPDYTGGTLNL